MIQTIILILSWVVIVFCYSASVSLCYRRGWLTRQIRVLELMLLTGKEIEKILEHLKKEPNPETIKFLSSWRKFSQSIINSQEPDWKDVFRRPKQKKKKD